MLYDSLSCGIETPMLTLARLFFFIKGPLIIEARYEMHTLGIRVWGSSSSKALSRSRLEYFI